MTSAEVKRFLVLISDIGRQEADAARRVSQGPIGDAFAAGVLSLRDELLRRLDIREFVDADSTSGADDLVKAMESFCFKWCAYSREQPPGTHSVCERCPLAKNTVRRIEKAAEAAGRNG